MAASGASFEKFLNHSDTSLRIQDFQPGPFLRDYSFAAAM